MTDLVDSCGDRDGWSVRVERYIVSRRATGAGRVSRKALALFDAGAAMARILAENLDAMNRPCHVELTSDLPFGPVADLLIAELDAAGDDAAMAKGPEAYDALRRAKEQFAEETEEWHQAIVQAETPEERKAAVERYGEALDRNTDNLLAVGEMIDAVDNPEAIDTGLSEILKEEQQ